MQDQPAALVGAGDVAMGRGAYSDAIGLYRRALRLEPEARAIYRKIADAERAAGDDDAADKAMSQANDRDPGIQDPLLAFVEAHGKGARFYRESGERALAEGDTPLAINLYEIASSIAPYDANTWLRLSELQRSAGDGKAAFSSLMRLVAYDPENAAAHFQIGNTLERLGDTAGADRGRRAGPHCMGGVSGGHDRPRGCQSCQSGADEPEQHKAEEGLPRGRPRPDATDRLAADERGRP